MHGRNHEERRICEDSEKKLKHLAKLGLGRRLVFQPDSFPKHTLLLVKNYLQKTTVIIIGWSAQSPVLNPIENL